jgi:hypothetical protein
MLLASQAPDRLEHFDVRGVLKSSGSLGLDQVVDGRGRDAHALAASRAFQSR